MDVLPAIIAAWLNASKLSGRTNSTDNRSRVEHFEWFQIEDIMAYLYCYLVVGFVFTELVRIIDLLVSYWCEMKT